MMSSNIFRLAIIHTFLILPFIAQAQDQTGFISIDCGISGVSRYTDAATEINYLSDSDFTESGENHEIAPDNKRKGDAQQLANLRSFPEGTRNCYTLKPKQGRGNKYLIRARFMYGNYDGKLRAPTFDLYLGANLWTTVLAWDSWTQLNMEIIHIPPSDHINVCLVNTGNGIPFISALELRPIGSEIYLSEAGTSLQLLGRYQFSTTSKYQLTRYSDDIYDRLWTTSKGEQTINTTWTSEILWSKGDFEVPIAVMSTAYTGNGSNDNVNINFLGLNKTSKHFFYMHFAELERLKSNQTRQFNIYVNDELWYVEPVDPFYLSTTTIRSGSAGTMSDSDGKLRLWLNNTKSANLSPLINAIELYVLTELPQQETNQTDVDAISNIKLVYGLKRNDWQGDPCAPETYRWSGINCSYDANSPPRIVALTLSSSGLKGEIAPSIFNLTMLQYLELSSNDLTGTVPEFLAHLSFLKVLNLKGNNFTGQVPKALLSKKDLQLSLDSNLSDSSSCSSGSCAKKKNFVVPLVSSLGGVVFVVLITVAVIWSLKRRRKQNATHVEEDGTVNVVPRAEDGVFGAKQQEFTYSEIQNITINFQRVLGEGGFGKVYHGFLNGNEVAVKILSSQSIQGHQQFHAELKLLLRVHHKNLTTLIGYCKEGTNVALIYEYMAMGNLRSHILGSGRSVLSWEGRLRTAIDAAQGLEYLHDGCKPPIIHRDVKSSNILLNDKFQAKLGDFGLSKIFPMEAGNHITASVAGTPGYLDPEYYRTSWLNEKSDVYSFGVVLLELITARPVLTKTRSDHIIEWVSSMLATGDIRRICDPKLGEDFDPSSVWKTIEIAMNCVSKTSSNRPTMSQATTELKECLTSELARKDSREVSDLSKDSSVEMHSRNMVSEFSPIAR